MIVSETSFWRVALFPLPLFFLMQNSDVLVAQAFYRQLVISSSATQTVNSFSIAVYEHAVAAAVYAGTVPPHTWRF